MIARLLNDDSQYYSLALTRNPLVMQNKSYALRRYGAPVSLGKVSLTANQLNGIK